MEHYFEFPDSVSQDLKEGTDESTEDMSLVAEDDEPGCPMYLFFPAS